MEKIPPTILNSWRKQVGSKYCHHQTPFNTFLICPVDQAARKFLGIHGRMIFQKFGPKPNWSSDFRPFGENFTWRNMLRSWASGRAMAYYWTPNSGKILSELPEIATPVSFWPKFLENHKAVNLQKISRGLGGLYDLIWGKCMLVTKPGSGTHEGSRVTALSSRPRRFLSAFLP